MKRESFSFWAALCALLFTGCGSEPGSPAAEDVEAEALVALPNDVVLQWHDHAVSALVAHDQYADPLAASRLFALVHLAMHDAVNATAHRAYRPYTFDERDRGAHPIAAAAAAAHRVLHTTYPAQTEALSEKLTASLSILPDGRARRRGVALGERVADALLEARRSDGSTETLAYAPGQDPGDYRFTTEGVIARPEWQNVTPWALERAAQFRPGPPPALDSEAYAAAFEEVRRRGAADGGERSPDEAAYARFWYEFSERGWNRVASVVAKQERLGLYATARLFGLVNLALADSYIAGWDAKFHHDFWRPISAIALAETDGNPSTQPVAGWSSFLPTPPVQDYPSTHSTLGAAAAQVLERYFAQRAERVGFSMTSTSASEPNEQRSFTSFTQAAKENADSRVVAGIHFGFSCDAGLDLGHRIGDHVFDNYLQSQR